MAEKIQTEYRGHVIEFQEFSEDWITQITEGHSFRKKSLAAVKKKIDEFFKAESEFKDIPAILTRSYGYRSTEFGQVVTITSVADNGDVWIKDSNGKREKVSKDSRKHLCTATPENEAKVKLYRDLTAESKVLDVRMGDIAASMQRVFSE